MKKILIIDHDKGYLQSISKKLTEEGYLVQIENDGEKGLEIANKYNFDLVAIDICLPMMSGCHALSMLEKKQKVPQILMVRDSDVIKDENFDIDDTPPIFYITKSTNSFDNLLAKIEEILD